MVIGITGTTGFVGQALGAEIARRNLTVLPLRIARAGDEDYKIGSVLPDVERPVPLTRVSALVHLAARVHVMQENSVDPLVAFRQANVAGTLELAAHAAAAGVRRFVFVSSVKVHGETTRPGRPFTELDEPAPQDAYALSKWEAEQGLHKIAASTGMDVVVIRPPLVYGYGVKANFAALMRAVQRGLPMPLAAVHNLRSLVGLDNLVDFIITCTRHPAAANQTFLVSDGADVSTTDLIRAIGRACGRPARLFPVPVGLLASLAPLVGKRAAVDRLCGNLQLDISKARDLLQWKPPHTLEEGLQRALTGAVIC